MSSTKENILKLDDVSVEIASKIILSHIDISLAKGEIVAITGPSGCGKTSLFRSICGLIDIQSGSIKLKGKTPDEIGWPEFRRRCLMVEQRPVIFDMSIEENLKLPFSYKTSKREFPENQAKELLLSLSLDDVDLSKNARDLSVGQQQRLCLVRGLLLMPDVFLFDEPTSALDDVNVAGAENLIRDHIVNNNLSALVITHSSEQAERLADIVIDLGEFANKGGIA